jgi:hypothetical protein
MERARRPATLKTLKTAGVMGGGSAAVCSGVLRRGIAALVSCCFGAGSVWSDYVDQTRSGRQGRVFRTVPRHGGCKHRKCPTGCDLDRSTEAFGVPMTSGCSDSAPGACCFGGSRERRRLVILLVAVAVLTWGVLVPCSVMAVYR